MKSFIFLFILLFTLVSCGEKGEVSKTSFNLRLGAAITNPSAFAGGLIITGRNLEGTQKFTLALTNDLELTLPKGAWEFSTIAWPSPVAGKKMTGPHTCSYKKVELRDDDQVVTFNMNLNNCDSAAMGRNEVFSTSYYYSILNSGSSTIGFKKLALIECSTIDINGSCTMASASSTYQSFRVAIPSFSDGVTASSMQDLSECEPITSGLRYSDFQIPVGGPNGFIRTNLKMYQTSNCVENGTPISSHSYPKGFANAVPNYSMMSIVSTVSLANSNFNYISTWDIGGTINTSGRVRGDLYLVNATSTTVPSISPGDFAYFNGSTYQMINGANMSVVGGRVYFNDFNLYMYIKP